MSFLCGTRSGGKKYMNFFLAKKTLLYVLLSGHKYGHRIHSPFVYDLITTVFRAKPDKSQFKKIEKRRAVLKADNTEIEIQDFGAGSVRNASNVRKISYIARTSLSQGKYARLLFNLVNRYKPSTILELGTSLGISTVYLATANPSARVMSLEGSPAIAAIADKTMSDCSAENVEIRVGNFNDTLSQALTDLQNVDFAFIDGNHTKDATLRYFEQIYPYCTEQSILIFDDISWSEGMREAWEQIAADQRVSISIDLCKQGIVFFRKGIEKQNFEIRY